MTKRLPWRFKQSFGFFNMLTVHKCSDTRLRSHLSSPIICSLYFQKGMASEAHLLFESIPNFMEILEMQEKLYKILFDFEIIAFELVALNLRFY